MRAGSGLHCFPRRSPWCPVLQCALPPSVLERVVGDFVDVFELQDLPLATSEISDSANVLVCSSLTGAADSGAWGLDRRLPAGLVCELVTDLITASAARASQFFEASLTAVTARLTSARSQLETLELVVETIRRDNQD